MLTLNISSQIKIPDDELLEIFISQKIKCQVTSTISSVPDKDGNYQIENGYQLLIFDIDGDKFKESIWPPLKEKLDIVCAYIKYRDEYMGCVLNWPGVFCKSNCPGKDF